MRGSSPCMTSAAIVLIGLVPVKNKIDCEAKVATPPQEYTSL